MTRPLVKRNSSRYLQICMNTFKERLLKTTYLNLTSEFGTFKSPFELKVPATARTGFVLRLVLASAKKLLPLVAMQGNRNEWCYVQRDRCREGDIYIYIYIYIHVCITKSLHIQIHIHLSLNIDIIYPVSRGRYARF